MSFYSDNGVDEEVAEIFGDFVGHACDVGANDGRFLSNSLHFEEKGWTVLCIEPNPLLASAGRIYRKLWREVACASRDAEGVDFHSMEGNNHASNSALCWEGQTHPPDTSDRKIFRVQVRTLDRVLEEAGFPRLDYLTVDVESWEREVIAGFTVERWKPRVIVLEEWTENAIEIPGYNIIRRRMFDNLYLRRGV